MTDQSKFLDILRDMGVSYTVIDKFGCDYVPPGIMVTAVDIEATAGDLQVAASFKFTKDGYFLGVNIANFNPQKSDADRSF